MVAWIRGQGGVPLASVILRMLRPKQGSYYEKKLYDEDEMLFEFSV
jgi:hypothetical protein